MQNTASRCKVREATTHPTSAAVCPQERPNSDPPTPKVTARSIREAFQELCREECRRLCQCENSGNTNTPARKATETSYTARRTLSDEAPRKTKAQEAKSVRARKANRSIVSSGNDFLSRGGSNKGPRKSSWHSHSAPSLASKRGLNPPSLTSDDRDVQEMRRELMHIFLEGVAQNTIVPVRDSSTRPEPTASMPRSESPPAHSGGQYLRILMQIFKVCRAVAMLPVYLLKTVLSDQPPWCGEHHEPGPRDDAPPGSPAHSRSVLTSAWRSIEDILEALSFDPSV